MREWNKSSYGAVSFVRPLGGGQRPGTGCEEGFKNSAGCVQSDALFGDVS